MDEISLGPQRDPRSPFGRWLIALAVAVAVAIAATLALTRGGGGGQHAGGSPSRSAGPPAPGPSPTTAPGTVLLSCGSATAGQLGSDWRAESLRAGPLWFIDGRQFGYVHHHAPRRYGHATRQPGRLHLVVMVIGVNPGSAVVMRPAMNASSFFWFADGVHPGGGNALPAGDSGFTLVACRRGNTGPGSQITAFYLGFYIRAGRVAPVEVWPSGASRPIRVILTCPVSSCPV